LSAHCESLLTELKEFWRQAKVPKDQLLQQELRSRGIRSAQLQGPVDASSRTGSADEVYRQRNAAAFSWLAPNCRPDKQACMHAEHRAQEARQR